MSRKEGYSADSGDAQRNENLGDATESPEPLASRVDEQGVPQRKAMNDTDTSTDDTGEVAGNYRVDCQNNI